MKRWIGLALLVFAGTAGWRIGEPLSPDALSMAVGLLFGVMAGVPTALVVIAASRRRPMKERTQPPFPVQTYRMNAPYGQQPPIVVIAGPQGSALQPAPSNTDWLPQDLPARYFTVVGDPQELVDDW